jgi:predicted nuclease with TOPRIM domain
MQKPDIQEAFQERLDQLDSALSEIRRKMEGLLAENQRIREVVRLAESELRKRRDQVHKLEKELHAVNDKQLEAKGRVENIVDRLDHLIAQSDKTDS